VSEQVVHSRGELGASSGALRDCELGHRHAAEGRSENE
jgi:hypothetical protein